MKMYNLANGQCLPAVYKPVLVNEKEHSIWISDVIQSYIELLYLNVSALEQPFYRRALSNTAYFFGKK